MIPILFDTTETSFSTNGIGRLSDAITCIVTEERNGPYELEMQYPITGQYFSELQHSRIIYATPADGKAAQPFRIYRIEKPLDGICTIYAEHISYELNSIPVTPFTAGTCATALAGLVSHSGQTNPFTVWTNKSVSATYQLKEPRAFRELLGGTQGSILDVYGKGEYEFDKYLVKLYVNRGTDSGVTIRYAKNLTELVNDENIEDVYTGVCPFWYEPETDTLVMLPEIAIWASTVANFPYKRTKIVDFTDEFETKPTVAQLRARTNKYIEDNNIGIPKVSIDVSFVPLWQTEGASLGSPSFDLIIPSATVDGDTATGIDGYVDGDTVYLNDARVELTFSDYKILERIHLCDTVTVVYDALGVSHTAKVIKTVYDVLRDRYESIEVGESKATLASIVTDMDNTVAQIETAGDEISEKLKSYVDHQTELITGGLGGYVLFGYNANGEPEEILIMDTADKETAVNVIRINKNGIGFSRTGYSGPFTSAWTIDGVFNTDFIGTGAITTNHLAASAVTASKIAANAVTVGKLASGVTDLINTAQTTADDATTLAAGKSTVYYRTTDPPSSGTYKAGDVWVKNVSGGIAGDVMWTYSGSAWIQHEVGTTTIIDGSITTDLLAANAVTAGKIAAGAITVGKLSDGVASSITTAQTTADNAASAAADLDSLLDDLTKVSSGTTYIDGGKIYTGSVTANAIGAGAITTAKLAAGAVTAAKLSLYGKMGVYTTSGLGTNGGYIGYMSGSDGTTTTTGIGVMDTNSKNYVIVTDSGIRATNTSGTNKTEMYLANGVTAFSGTSFRAEGTVRLNYDGSSYSGITYCQALYPQYSNAITLQNNAAILAYEANSTDRFWMLYSDSSNNTYLGNTSHGTIIRGSSISCANALSVTGNITCSNVIRKYSGSNLLAYISESNNAGYMRLQETNGNAVVSIYKADGGNGAISFYQSGNVIAYISGSNNAGYIRVQTTSGNPVASIYRSDAGNGVLALYDSTGAAHYLTPTKIDQI